MGLKIIIPVPGNNCTRWPDPAETPSSIYVLFEGIKKGDNPAARVAPNGRIFRLSQMVGDACAWQYHSTNDGWKTTLYLAAQTSGLDLRDGTVTNQIYFHNVVGPSPLVEYDMYLNDHDSHFYDWGWDGYAIIFWTDPFIWVPGLLGLDTLDDLFLEVFSDDSGTIYLKYCSVSAQVNVTYKIPQ